MSCCLQSGFVDLFLFIFGGTQVLTLARQVLYHLSPSATKVYFLINKG
jgi:hypothetical protein